MSEQLSLAEAARTLVAQARRALLSSASDDDGTPYGSLVEVAATGEGDLLMLLSRLAEHRRFLEATPAASITITPHLHEANALARPRLSLLGEARLYEPSDDERANYLKLHPNAEMYLSLGDFNFFRLRVARLRYIAGFGRMGWLPREDYVAAQADPLWQVAASAIEHMNQDHRDSLVQYARHYGEMPDALEAVVWHVDRWGMNLQAANSDEQRELRIPFRPPVTDAGTLRKRLAEMATQARAANA